MKVGLGLATVVAASLGGCATMPGNGPVEVTRFHLGAPLETGSLVVEPLPGSGPPSLEFKTYAAAVQTEALAHGFTVPATTGSPGQYFAVVGFTRDTRQAAPRGGGSGVSIGLGGGSGGYGGGVGVGGSFSFPIGKPRYRTVVLTDLSVQIRRRSDATVIWEGHAQTAAPGEAPMPKQAKRRQDSRTRCSRAFPENRVALSRSDDKGGHGPQYQRRLRQRQHHRRRDRRRPR